MSENPHSPLDRDYWDRVKVCSKYLEFKVNSFHQASHNAECADEHSLRNTPNVGRLSGEDIETVWSVTNHFQYSSREMDAGTRRDLISTVAYEWNKEKIAGLHKYEVSFSDRLKIDR